MFSIRISRRAPQMRMLRAPATARIFTSWPV
jgi:hypothetical protein